MSESMEADVFFANAIFFDAARAAVRVPRRFGRRFIAKFFMNADDLVRLFTQGNDYRVLGTINDVYRRVLQEDVAEAATIPPALCEYYLRTGRRSNLPLEEAQGGLAYREDNRLWAEFIRLGLEDSFVRTFIGDVEEADREVANFRRVKAGQDRRVGRLEEAEQTLLTQRAALEADPAARAKLAIVDYELGYINYLQADLPTAIRYFRDSAARAGEGGDEVGVWIGRCVEYAARWEHGYASAPAARAVLRAAKSTFLRFLDSPSRGKAARRWLMSCILHELTVEFGVGDSAAVDRLLAECKSSPAKEAIPEVPGYLDLYEAMSAMLKAQEPRPSAVELLDGIVAQKRSGTAVALWYSLEAGARDLYLLGIAHQKRGDLANARTAWAGGANFEDQMGNQIWRARCQAELDAIANQGSEEVIS